jgi:hypothetical protein
VTITLEAATETAPTTIVASQDESDDPTPAVDGTMCSFCGKTSAEAQRIIAGANAFICDECVVLCNDIVTDET